MSTAFTIINARTQAQRIVCQCPPARAPTFAEIKQDTVMLWTRAVKSKPFRSVLVTDDNRSPCGKVAGYLVGLFHSSQDSISTPRK